MRGPNLLLLELLTGIDVVCRWAAHWAEIAVLVHPPSTGGHTDLAAPFKLSHGSKGLSLAVYEARVIKVMTVSSGLDFYYGPKLAAQKRFQCEARHKYL